MRSLQLILILAFCFSLNASAEDDKISVYCIGSESVSVRQLHNQILSFLIEEDLYTSETQLLQLINYCGPKLLTLKSTRAIAEKVAERFSAKGVKIQENTEYNLTQTTSSTAEEQRDIQSSEKRNSELKNISLKDQLQAAIDRLQPIIPDIKTLEALKAEMPHNANILTEQIKKAQHLHQLDRQGLIVELKIEMIENFLFREFIDIQYLNQYSVDTYEIFAQTFYNKLLILDAHMSEFEIADVINRNIVILEPPKKAVTFGPFMQRLFSKLSSYSGLTNYAYVLLKALNGTTDEIAIRPSDLVIEAYQAMWKAMPMRAKEGTDVKLPIMHYGPLPRHRPLDVSIVDGVHYIEKWLKAHSLPVIKWTNQTGITLDDARKNLLEYRKGLSQNKTCNTALIAPKTSQE